MLKLADWRHSLRLSWRRSSAPKLQRPWKKKHAAVIFRKNFAYIFCRGDKIARSGREGIEPGSMQKRSDQERTASSHSQDKATLSFSDSSDMQVGIPGVIPFTWEEQPGRPKQALRPSSALVHQSIHDPFRGSIRRGSMQRGSIPRATPPPEITAVVGFEETSSSSSSSSDEDSAGLEARVMRLNLKASLMGVHILDDETEMFFSRQLSNASSTNTVSSGYGASSFRHTIGGAVPFKWEVEPGKPLQLQLDPSSSSNPHETRNLVGPLQLPPPPGSRASTSGSLYSQGHQLIRISAGGGSAALQGPDHHQSSSQETHHHQSHHLGLKILRKPARESSSETLDRHFGHYDCDLTYETDAAAASTATSPTSTLDHAERSISSDPDFFPDGRELLCAAAATTHLRQFKKLVGVGSGSSQLAQCLLGLTEMANDTTDEDDIILDGNATGDWQTAAETELRTHDRQTDDAQERKQLGADSFERQEPREFVGLPDEVCSLEWSIVPYRRRRRRIRNNCDDGGPGKLEEISAGSSSPTTTTQQERWSSNSSSWNLSLVAQTPKMLNATNVPPSASVSCATNPQSAPEQQAGMMLMGARLETGTSVVREVRRLHSARSSSSCSSNTNCEEDPQQHGRMIINKWERYSDSAMSSSAPPSTAADRQQLGFEAYDRPEEVVHTVDEEDFPFSPIASSFVFEENNNSVEFSSRGGGGEGGGALSAGMIPKAVGPIVQEFTTTNTIVPQFENQLPREFYEEDSRVLTSDNSVTSNELTHSLETGALEPQQQQQQWVPTKSFHYIRGNGIDMVHELSFSSSAAFSHGYLELLNTSGRFSIDLQRSPRLERHRSSSSRLQQQCNHKSSTPEVLIRIMKDATNLNNPKKKKTTKKQQPAPSKTSCSQCKCLPVPRKGFLGRCLSSNHQRPRLAVTNSFDDTPMRTVNERAPTGPFQFF
ncbi:unnamed protein product [Sphagnum compactum]